MADIDFDELDKAVNDLMANVDTSKRPAGLDDPEDKVITVAETKPQDASKTTSVVDTNTDVSIDAAASTTPVVDPPVAKSEVVASPSLAVKRRGQFMDIVHPSLDMTSAAPKPISRQGVTLQPSVDGVTAPVAVAAAPAPTPEEAPSEVVADQPVADSAWPDPIDMATTQTDTEPAEVVDTNQPVDAAHDAATGVAPAEPEPLSSPFLPDAKPEKRPLGGLSDATPAADATPEAAPAESSTAAPIVLPEEFSGDLMAVESRDLSNHPDIAKSGNSVTSAPVEHIDVAPEPQTEMSTTSVTSDTQPPAGGSIAQQYTEQPSSGDQTNGSIYDTATYHQAIAGAQPVKKKSSLLTWIIWIVVLLLVGATAGAAYFYFTR